MKPVSLHPGARGNGVHFTLLALASAAAVVVLFLYIPKGAILAAVALVGAVMLGYLLQRPERTYLAMVFFLPIIGIGRFEVGVTVTLSKLFAALLVAQIIVLKFQGRLNTRLPWSPPDRFLPAFWLYCLIISLVALFTLDRVVPFAGFSLRGPTLRFAGQLSALMLMAGVYFGTRLVVRDAGMIRRSVQTVLLSFALSAVYGFYQFVGYRFGWPLTDIRQGSTAISRVGVFFEMTRISSLAGEPRQLALTMLPAIVMLLSFRASSHLSWARGRNGFLLLLLLLTAFLGTFSRAGYILLPACLLGLPFLVGRTGTARLWKTLATCLLFVVPIGLIGTQVLRISLLDMFMVRIGETTVQKWEGTVEFPKTRVALATAAEHPVFGVGLGNATFHIKSALAEEGFSDMAPVENPPSQFLTLLVETGIVGLTLFLAFSVGTLLYIRRRLEAFVDLRVKAMVIGILSAAFSTLVVCAYMSWLSEPFLWFWLGLACAAADLPAVKTPEPLP